MSKAVDLARFWCTRAQPDGIAVAKLADVQTLLHEAGVADNVICFEAQIPLALSRAALRARVEECWHLTEQNAMYETFIQSFRPLVPLLKETADELTPERAFHIQLLLIHFIAVSSLKTHCCRRSCFRHTGQGIRHVSCVSTFISA